MNFPPSRIRRAVAIFRGSTYDDIDDSVGISSPAVRIVGVETGSRGCRLSSSPCSATGGAAADTRWHRVSIILDGTATTTRGKNTGPLTDSFAYDRRARGSESGHGSTQLMKADGPLSLPTTGSACSVGQVISQPINIRTSLLIFSPYRRHFQQERSRVYYQRSPLPKSAAASGLNRRAQLLLFEILRAYQRHRKTR